MKKSTTLLVCILAAQISFGQGVGIGTSTPHAPLHFNNLPLGRKIILWEGDNNDHQYLGFGANLGILRYQVGATTDNHVFYAGATTSSSNELMRIQGNGNVGIGINTAQNKLDILSNQDRSGSHATGRALYVTGDFFEASNGVEFRHYNGTQGIGFGHNTIYAAGSGATQNLGIKAKGTTGNEILSTNEVERFRVTGDGRVGIGTASPGATLEIARGTAPSGSLWVNGTSYPSHFNFGASEDTYIRGGKPGAKVIINEYSDLGNVGIGTANPGATLEIERGTAQFGTLQINGTNHDSHFNYGVPETTYIRGGKPGANVIINELGGLGNVGVGTASPAQKLHVGGNVAVDGDVGIGIATPLQNRLDILQSGTTRSGSHATGRALYVTGDLFESSNGVEFRHTNGTQGIGFGYNTIYATGSDPAQNLGIKAKGTTGNVILSTNEAERMRVNGAGNVGIGVTNPGATLEIERGTAPFGTLQINGTNHDSHFNYGAPETTYIRGGKPGANVIINELGGLGNVGIGTASPAQKLHVAGNAAVDGNVGLGTTTPTEKLDVNGNVDVSGNLEIGYVRVSSSVNVIALTSGFIQCHCPPGTQVIGGGHGVNYSSAFEITSSYPPNSTSWVAEGHNTGLVDKLLTAYAICARITN